MKIYHIISESDWENTKNLKEYFPLNFKIENFIHCLKIEQFVRVTNPKLKNRKNLLLLQIETKKVKSPIRFEKLSGTVEEHPHIYGGLNLSAVEKVYRMSTVSSSSLMRIRL